MRYAPIRRGREFVVAFDHGDDFFGALEKFCAENELRSGYIPPSSAGSVRPGW